MSNTPKNPYSRPFAHSLRRLLGAGIIPLLALIATATPSPAAIEAVRIATGLTIPLYVCSPPGDNSRLFIAEQMGKIKIYDIASGNVLPTPFLDITFEVGQGQGPGILGMTFDPDYATNGHFYVNWTSAGDGAFASGVSHVARFTVSSNPNFADPSTEVTILTADQPDTDHNFDWMGFSNRRGDEGNLYICTGDGGRDYVPNGNAQNLGVLLGKILRIHIEADGSYTIPRDNPFFGSSTAKQEIWAYGLRNPFRASFDRQTGDMYIGDVGETMREEVDFNSARRGLGGGENFGWRIREGLIQNPRYQGVPPPPDAVDPIIDYEHGSTGICVIGGYIYRGRAVRDLKGLYVFGDCFGPSTGDFTGRIFTLSYRRGVVSGFTDITSQLFPTRVGGYTLSGVTSFGEDNNGELYIATVGGDIFQIKNSR